MNLKIILTGLILTITFASLAQDTEDILRKAFYKCQSVQKGYYEMTHYMKYMTEKDTSTSSYICYFRKLKDDTLYSSAFHYKYFLNGEYSGDVLYTGEDFVTTYTIDSTARIMSKKLWSEEIKSYSHNYTFFSPLTNHNSFPLPHDSEFTDKRHFFKFIGNENVNNVGCFHIQVNYIPQNDNTDMMKTLRIEYHLWISHLDFIPIQYSLAYDMVMNNDIMYQYEKFILTKFEINSFKDEHILTLKSIPDYFKIKDYVPYKSPDPLAKNTIAPNWQLISLSGERISLADLKGKLVLIDFFYKGCYPCILAFPSLQALNEKYKDKGLLLLGIDPYDKKEDDIESFLAKHGVTYTVLLGGKDVANDYQVSSYPTIYIVDKNGKIIFTQVGYGKGIETILEKVILENL